MIKFLLSGFSAVVKGYGKFWYKMRPEEIEMILEFTRLHFLNKLSGSQKEELSKQNKLNAGPQTLSKSIMELRNHQKDLNSKKLKKEKIQLRQKILES
jgi:hypothetical protein